MKRPSQLLAIHSPRRLTARIAVSALLALLVSPAMAQVNGPGPSPASEFDTVLNLPGDEAVIDSSQRIPISSGQTTQLNVTDGGEIGSPFAALFGSEVNISGGNVGSSFDAFEGSVININGGTIGRSFEALDGSVVNVSGGTADNLFAARSGSEVNISGGTFSAGFFANSGSDVELIGGEFRVNGADFTGGTISLADDDVFTGTLADGSSFIFSDVRNDRLNDVNLTVTRLPPVDLNPIVIDAPIINGPSGLRAGQTLTVVDGGSLGNVFAVIDATFNVEAGTVGDDAEVFRSLVNISGGVVGNEFDAYQSLVNISGGDVGIEFEAYQTEVNISGGTVGSSFEANSGSLVNISDGTVGGLDGANNSIVLISGGTVNSLNAFFGSVVYISGGVVDDIDANSGSTMNISGSKIGLLDANFGCTVDISGGTFNLLYADPRSDVELIGGEFRLNGDDFTDGTITLATDDVFTGTLADGSSFIFKTPFGFPGNDDPFSDLLVDVTLTVASLPAADLDPIIIDTPLVSGPSGLRAGQTLTLAAGGSLCDLFAVVDATLNVEAGIVGNGTETSNSVVNISGGTIGDDFEASSGSVVNISGGTVGSGFAAFSGSLVNISGGTFNGDLLGFEFSTVNISGSQFFIDGVELDALQLDQAFTITDRNVTLSGVLVDGEPFSFDLNSIRTNSDGFFDPDAMLTVTLTAPFLLGDCDQNGIVDFVDINPFIAILASESFLGQADCNQDGVVNFFDINSFIGLLAAGN